MGCIPSKALIAEAHRYEVLRQLNQADTAVSFVNAQAFKQGIVNKQAGGVGYLMKTVGVSILEGEASLVDEHTAIIKQHGAEQTISFKHAILATSSVGRKPNTDGRLGLEHIGLPVTSRGLIETDEQCRTAIPHIFAIGDITAGPALAHKASYEAKIAAEAIAGQAAKVDYKAIPLVVFSEPELAGVGLSETEAKEQALPIVIGRASFTINGRALALRAAEGYIKIVAKQDSGVVLGAQIVGVEASTLISELALAIEMGATVEDLALTIHPHPTLGEVIMEAAENAVRKMDSAK